MLFDLQGAHATFQRMVIRYLMDSMILLAHYMDNVIVFSKSWNEYLQHMGKHQEASLTIKRKKCQFEMRYNYSIIAV